MVFFLMMLWLLISVMAGVVYTTGEDENEWRYVYRFYLAFLFWWVMWPTKLLVRYYPHK